MTVLQFSKAVLLGAIAAAFLTVSVSSDAYAKKSDKSSKSMKSDKSSKSKKRGNKHSKLQAQIDALQAQIEVLISAHPPASKSLSVDCNAGESLNAALQTPASLLEVSFSGSCFEDVKIERNNVILIGEAGSEIQGTVDVDIQSGEMEMRSVSINNSLGTGLNIASGSKVEAVNLHVNGASGNGIFLSDASFECADCSSTFNAGDGIVLSLGSRALVGGTFQVSNNSADGIEVFDSSTFRTSTDPESLGASSGVNLIEANDNGAFAVLLYGSSAILFDGGANLTASGNPNGIAITTGSTGHFLGDVEARNNGLAFSAFGGSVFLGGTLTAMDNNVGIFLSEGSILRGNGAAILTDNNFGFFLRASESHMPNITANNNATAAGLFESGSVIRAGAAVVTGQVICDGTEVINATFGCGAN